MLELNGDTVYLIVIKVYLFSGYTHKK